MKPKNTILSQLRPNSLQQSNTNHFRIRSSSKDKFISTMSKSKQKSFNHQQDQPKNHNLFTQRIKLSHKQLRKILTNRRHQRQKSQDIDKFDKRFLETLDSRINKEELYNNELNQFAQNNEVKTKILYEDLKTQQSHLNRKNWIDIQSIDTSQDIKILDKITNLYDPFRIIKQCDSKAKLQRKSEDHKVKSISVKKSKLTDKINTLVFQMASKSKSKNGFKIHRNKFQSINNPSKQTDQTIKKSPKQISPKQSELQTVKKSSPIPVTPRAVPKQLEISSQLQQKAPQTQRPTKPQLLNIQPKPKHKINIHNMKQNNKNQVMQKFWSGINESLILAAQQDYVSKDLNQLLYNNMS